VLRIFRSSAAKVITIILVLQAALLFSAIRPEAIPPTQPLASSVPRAMDGWQFGFDGVIEQEVLDVLQADDVLDRWYVSPQGAQANLYIAAFRSQRNGKAPHSPKNCLPGSGWSPVVEDYLKIDVGQAAPIEVNRYIVAQGEQRSLVLYWYQSRERAVANEYRAKFWVIADAIRLNRTDTAIVRVLVPIRGDDAAAQNTAVSFIRDFYPSILNALPK